MRHFTTLFLLIGGFTCFAQKEANINANGQTVYEVELSNYLLEGLTDFGNLTVDGNGYFISTVFDSTAFFDNATFGGLTDFGSAHFKGFTTFYSVAFKEALLFNHTTFDDELDFGTAEFDSLVDFSRATFNGPVTFHEAQLPKVMNWSYATIKHPIDLKDTQLSEDRQKNKEKCLINLIGAPVEQFDMTYENFKVYVPDSLTTVEFQKLSSVYERLLKGFQSKGYASSYESLDKEFQAFKFNRNPDHSQLQNVYFSLINFINREWNDYGYAKERIWQHTGILLLIFTILNWLIFPYLFDRVYQMASISDALKEKPLKTNTIPNFRRLDLAFFYTCLLFFGFNMSVEQLKFNRTLGVVYVFLQYGAGLICMAYLANFVISSGLIGV